MCVCIWRVIVLLLTFMNDRFDTDSISPNVRQKLRAWLQRGRYLGLGFRETRPLAPTHGPAGPIRPPQALPTPPHTVLDQESEHKHTYTHAPPPIHTHVFVCVCVCVCVEQGSP
jgi:hypothetical protein